MFNPYGFQGGAATIEPQAPGMNGQTRIAEAMGGFVPTMATPNLTGIPVNQPGYMPGFVPGYGIAGVNAPTNFVSPIGSPNTCAPTYGTMPTIPAYAGIPGTLNPYVPFAPQGMNFAPIHPAIANPYVNPFIPGAYNPYFQPTASPFVNYHHPFVNPAWTTPLPVNPAMTGYNPFVNPTVGNPFVSPLTNVQPTTYFNNPTIPFATPGFAPTNPIWQGFNPGFGLTNLPYPMNPAFASTTPGLWNTPTIGGIMNPFVSPSYCNPFTSPIAQNFPLVPGAINFPFGPSPVPFSGNLQPFVANALQLAPQFAAVVGKHPAFVSPQVTGTLPVVGAQLAAHVASCCLACGIDPITTACICGQICACCAPSTATNPINAFSPLNTIPSNGFGWNFQPSPFAGIPSPFSAFNSVLNPSIFGGIGGTLNPFVGAFTGSYGFPQAPWMTPRIPGPLGGWQQPIPFSGIPSYLNHPFNAFGGLFPNMTPVNVGCGPVNGLPFGAPFTNWTGNGYCGLPGQPNLYNNSSACWSSYCI